MKVYVIIFGLLSISKSLLGEEEPIVETLLDDESYDKAAINDNTFLSLTIPNAITCGDCSPSNKQACSGTWTTNQPADWHANYGSLYNLDKQDCTYYTVRDTRKTNDCCSNDRGVCASVKTYNSPEATECYGHKANVACRERHEEVVTANFLANDIRNNCGVPVACNPAVWNGGWAGGSVRTAWTYHAFINNECDAYGTVYCTYLVDCTA